VVGPGGVVADVLGAGVGDTPVLDGVFDWGVCAVLVLAPGLAGGVA
jgi:hypothetical protein